MRPGDESVELPALRTSSGPRARERGARGRHSHRAGPVRPARARYRDGVRGRFEQLELSARHDGSAQVVSREFPGHDALYRLRHEGGRTVLVQLPSLELYDVGARVL